jgi:hypothetical protein
LCMRQKRESKIEREIKGERGREMKRGREREKQIMFDKCFVLPVTCTKNYGKIMRCALFEILYLTELYLVTD